jgi:3-oxoadipate enol-lactonase
VGGMIAMGYADKHPQKVRALVLADTAHKIGTVEMWNQRIHAVTSDGLESIAESVMQRWFTADYLDARRESVFAWINMLCRTPVEGYAGTCAAIRDADLTEAASRIAVPTMCLCGDEDGATPPDLVSSLARIIPHTQFHLIPGAGHIPCVEQPTRFIELVQNFLEGQDLGR